MGIGTRGKKHLGSKKTTKATVTKKVPDYGNDPFFVKKAQESQVFLEKHGFPTDLVRKK